MAECRKGSGRPDVTSSQESRKLFRFAKASKNDTFYDLGCGYATPCIVAAEDFKMKKIVGVESCKGNFMEAMQRIRKKKLSEKICLRYESIESCSMNDATLIYFVLEPNLRDVNRFEKNLKKGCRLITPNTPLPSIKPVKTIKTRNEEFFLMKAPLRKYKAKNPDAWVKSFSNYVNFKDYCDSLSKGDKKWLVKLIHQLY